MSRLTCWFDVKIAGQKCDFCPAHAAHGGALTLAGQRLVSLDATRAVAGTRATRGARPWASAPARPARGSGGFTLLEVIVVVLMIALAAGAMAGMAYRQSDSFRLTLAGRQAYGFLRTARSFALLDEAENRCLYDPASRELVEEVRGRRMRLPDGVDVAVDLAEEAIEDEPDRSAEAEEGLPLARFYADGSSDGASIILYAGQRELRLSMDPVFGWVRLEKQVAEARS